MNNIICKLYTGTVTIDGERLKYSLRIDNKSRGDSDRNFEVHEATFTAANKDNDIVDMFSREYSDRWGEYSAVNIKRAMLQECRENFS